MEGGLREITIELHKRDANLRKEAIEKYGYACCVCGFNFKECYGDVGANFIEVHHLEPLSMKKKDQINTVNDVCVVCANCHRVLHKNGATPMKIDELRQIVKSMKEKKKDLLDKIAA
jgi:5-methylcytosine-specific restriction protein A